MSWLKLDENPTSYFLQMTQLHTYYDPYTMTVIGHDRETVKSRCCMPVLPVFFSRHHSSLAHVPCSGSTITYPKKDDLTSSYPSFRHHKNFNASRHQRRSLLLLLILISSPPIHTTTQDIFYHAILRFLWETSKAKWKCRRASPSRHFEWFCRNDAVVKIRDWWSLQETRHCSTPPSSSWNECCHGGLHFSHGSWRNQPVTSKDCRLVNNDCG